MASRDESSRLHDQHEWKDIEDRDERRRVQNRDAQRRRRDKCRREEEQKQRIATNQSAAGSSYTPVRFNEGSRTNPEGLPWGSYALTGIGSGTSTKTDSGASSKSFANVQKASQDPRWDQTSRNTTIEPSRQLQVPLSASRGRAASTYVPRRRGIQLTQVRSLGLLDMPDSKSGTKTNMKRKRDEGYTS